MPDKHSPRLLTTDPFDDDKLREECGIFGVTGVSDAANFVALGLHALQHRGQEAGGIVTYEPIDGFHSARRFGLVRDNFTKLDVIDGLPYDGRSPTAYLESLSIGLKQGQTVTGSGVEG